MKTKAVPMENKTYCYGKFGRFGGLLFAMPVSVYLLISLFSLLSLRDWFLKFSVGQYPEIGEIIGFLLLASLFLVEIWLFAGMSLYPLTCKIFLSDTFMEIQSINFWGRKFLHYYNKSYPIGRIQYENIMFIDADAWRPGIAKLIFRDGRHILLAVRSLENYPDFVEQLAGKLDVMQVGQFFLKLSQPRRFKVILPFIYILAFLPSVVLYFSMTLDHWSPRVWNEELGPWFTHSVSYDSDDTLWALTSPYKGDYYIWHLSGENNKHWTLPKEICIECDFSPISHDSRGFPIVISTEVDPSDKSKSINKVNAWDGQNWVKYSLPQNLSVRDDLSISNLYAMDTRVWGQQNGNLAYIDFAVNEVRVFQSPEEMQLNGFKLQQFKANWDGSLLVKFVAEGKPEFLYRVIDEKWQKLMEYSSSELRILDFCQDFQGNIWATTLNLANGQARLGYYDIQDAVWAWNDLNLEKRVGDQIIFQDLAVDAKGRVWLLGIRKNKDEKDSLSRFVLVGNWTEGSFVPIVEYTENNSNLDIIDYFIVTNNKIWTTFGSLYWIDTNVDDLPSPMPDWVVWLKDFHDDYFGQYLLMAVGSFFLLIVAFFMEKY
jgi:hypothetical protein